EPVGVEDFPRSRATSPKFITVPGSCHYLSPGRTRRWQCGCLLWLFLHRGTGLSRERCVVEQRHRELLVEPIKVGKTGDLSRVIHHGREIRQMNGNFTV